MATTLYHVVLAVLALLQLADIYTTNRVIANGGHESNPALAWIMERLGGAWWIAKLGVAGTAVYILYRMGSQPVAVLGAIVAVGAYAWVVRHNWQVIRRQERRR